MKDLEQLIEPFIEKQFTFHKGITFQDIYKLLYQSHYGADHLVRDKDAARKYFFQEVEELQIPKVKKIWLPMVEQISEDKVRVNFIPYSTAGGDFNELFDIFIADAPDSIGPHNLIENSLTALIELNKKKSWFPKDKVKDFFQLVKQSNFPPMHHSESYQDILTKEILTKPHYRVVLSDRILH